MQKNVFKVTFALRSLPCRLYRLGIKVPFCGRKSMIVSNSCLEFRNFKLPNRNSKVRFATDNCISKSKACSCYEVKEAKVIQLHPLYNVSLTNSTDLMVQDLKTYPWFMGDINRPSAELILQKSPTGTYLLRYRKEKERFAIALSFSGSVRHIKVEEGLVGYYLSPEAPSFEKIEELVMHYQTTGLDTIFSVIKTFLLLPVKNRCLGEYRALYDFNAESEKELSFLADDVIFVISRRGNDKGWWLGQLNNKVGFFPFSYVVHAATSDTD